MWTLAAILLLGAGTAAPLEITYVANEGFLLVSADDRVLIDGLFRDGLGAYEAPPSPVLEQLGQATGPFEGLDLILVTHVHADHLDPGLVATHLKHSPAVRVVGTPQVRDAVVKEGAPPAQVMGVLPPEGSSQSIDGSPGVTVVQLHHGRGRSTQNLGFLAEVGSWVVLHVGDTQATPAEFAQLELAGRGIDVALIPFWLLLDDAPGYLDAIGADTVVPIHVPAAGQPSRYFGRPGSRQAVFAALKDSIPNVLILDSRMESANLVAE